VLVLDDLHWADKPTLLLLQHLARNLRRERILLVGTYRDVELDRTHPLSDEIAGLRREHLYERVLLRGLERDEVKAFIESVGDQSTPTQFAEMIYRETEGNPFFVAEILRHLAESGALQRVDGHWVGTAESVAEHLPEGVREVIGRRLSLLDHDTNRMLTVGAAMPGGFSLEVVARVLDDDEDHVLDLLDEALARQVVRERRDQPGVYEFSHALIRQTLYSELSTPRRVRLHRQILAALEELHGANLDARLTELAYHAFQAAPGGDVAKAVDYATRAGERAAASAAYEEAARSYDLALQALELEPATDARQRATLLLALGDAQHHAGQREAARAALAEVAEIGRDLDDPQLVALAAVVYGGNRFTSSGSDAMLMELLQAAVAQQDRLEDGLRSQILAGLSVHVAFLDAARAAALAEEALAAARRSGDDRSVAGALLAYSYSHTTQEGSVASEYREEVARYAAASGDVSLQLTAVNGLFIDALWLGDRARLDRVRSDLTALAETSRSPFVRFVDTMAQACVAILEGRYASAEMHIAEAAASARRTQDRTNMQTIGVALLPMLRELGRSAELVEPTRRVADEYPSIASWRAGLAQVLIDIGQLDEAGAHLESIARDGFASVGGDVLRPYALTALAEVAFHLRDAAIADELAELLRERSGTCTVLGNSAFQGAVDRSLGLLATTVGRHDEAVARHEAALALHDRMRARPWSARSKSDLASALLARDGTGHRERALGLLNEALDTANELGMVKLQQEVLTAKLAMQGIQTGVSITASIDAVAAGVSIERPDLRRHAASDGTVTVLFSDIEGYTELNERLGDARTQDLLRAHGALVREAVDAWRGTVVKSQGDGYMLVFGQPVDGLGCAVALQRAMHGHEFGDDAGAVRMRIGLHAGAVIREGDDFFGRTVILAARIASEAGGGEILLSDALTEIASDGARYGGKPGPSRQVELKGFRTAHAVHRLDW
jgi:class 3 adenylate cyclase